VQEGIPLVVTVLLSTFGGVRRIPMFIPKNLWQDQARETVWKSVLEVHRRFLDDVALLDPIQGMGIKDDKFKILIQVRWFCSLAVGTGHRY
jgi:ATP-dependent RNA helicase DOB1